ncbi:MAG TPA: hypothetical protein VGQ83_24235 [Polyangia bacterium]|jgi:hypothetical protein
MRFTGLALALALAVMTAACAAETNVQLKPLGSGTAGGTTRPMLFANSADWTGSPGNLTDYLTPVAIRITNVLDRDVRVSYADFSLFDEKGVRYAVVSPFTTQTARAYDVEGPRSALEQRSPYIPVRETNTVGVENRDAHSPGWDRQSQTAGNTGPWLARRPSPLEPAAEPPRGFLVASRESPFFTTVPAWSGDLPDPPGYDALVVSWSRVPKVGPATASVQRRALPEGVLQPGGHVTGYVYFENALAHASRVQLTWNIHDLDGRSLATLQVPFVVVGR